MREKLPEQDELREIFASMGFVTACTRMTPVLQRAYKASRASDATVLLEGETGTGKQVLARAIHRLDAKRGFEAAPTVRVSGQQGRAQRPFIDFRGEEKLVVRRGDCQLHAAGMRARDGVRRPPEKSPGGSLDP